LTSEKFWARAEARVRRQQVDKMQAKRWMVVKVAALSPKNVIQRKFWERIWYSDGLRMC